MEWKSKLFLFYLCLQLLFLSLSSLGSHVMAEAANTSDGFIIEADRVVGTGMTATIVKQETSTSDGVPMLRFYYQTATIYGMKVTKQLNTGKGTVSITLKAGGPVTVKGMTVDTTAISFKGACIKASEKVPELGMEKVVMIAHYMNSKDSNLESLILNTVSGGTGTAKPDKLKVLQDLSSLPVSQLDKEIERLTAGHLPLTCEDDSVQGSSSGIGQIKDPLTNVVGAVVNSSNPVLKPPDPVLNQVDPVLKPLNPVLNQVDPVLKPLNPVLNQVDPVLKPLDPVLNQVDPVLKPLNPVLNQLEPAVAVLKPLDPIVSGATGQILQTTQTACMKIQDTNGVITKELALNLIDEAIGKNVSLSSVCQSNPAITTELQNWEVDLLKVLGLSNLLGSLVTPDPIQQLTKMRAKIAAEKDGNIVYKP